MELYEVLILIHISFTSIAIVSGIIAMAASPKGNLTHRRSGSVYFYSFIGIVLTGYIMTSIKYKDLFLGFTIFNTYFLLMGYRMVKYKNQEANWLDWILLSVFVCGGLLMLVGAFRIDDSFFQRGYRWSIVRGFYSALTFYYAFKDFRHFRNKLPGKKSWLINHMEKMLLTYVSLIGGILIRVADLFPGELKWTCWIVPYIVCIPLITYWISKYKPKDVKPAGKMDVAKT
jgi:hypothetical protein